MNFFSGSRQPKQPSSDPFHRLLNNMQTSFTNFARISNPVSFGSSDSISSKESPSNPGCQRQDKNLSLSAKEITQRLADVRVTRIRRRSQAFIPLGHEINGRKAVFYFFSESDADALRSEVNRRLGNRYQVTNVSLAEIFYHNGYEDPPRLVPDLSEVQNALKERKKAGYCGDVFAGVPVFQSDALRVTIKGSPNKYRPAYFKKEDLENALRQEKELSQIDTEKGIVQVTALEDIIQQMKDSSSSRWNDVVFVPPTSSK